MAFSAPTHITRLARLSTTEVFLDLLMEEVQVSTRACNLQT